MVDIMAALSPALLEVTAQLVNEGGVRGNGLATLSSPAVLKEIRAELPTMLLQKITVNAEG